MGDVDLLVPAGRYAECERALLARGFRQLDEGDPEDAPYHGPPFYDPPRNTWVELHTSLFPGTSELVGNSLFGAGCVARETRACAFEGRKCYRLSQELQVVYIAASWMSDMTSHGIDPSFVTALFDAVYLLKAARRSLDWPIVIGLLDNELAAASLWLMLGFLARHHLAEVDAEVLAQIAQRQRLVGALQASVIHAMLDRYVLGGRPWNLRIPLPVAGRYSIHRQWRKRIARRHLVCASAC
jgi:hypothetical protein